MVKRYRYFWLMLLLFIIGHVGICLLDINNKNLVLLIINWISIWTFLLTLVIYLTDSIYWYSGIMFDEVKNLEKSVRDRYAIRVMKRFLGLMVIVIVYSLFSFFFSFHYGFDIVLGSVGLISTAISTINIRLK